MRKIILLVTEKFLSRDKGRERKRERKAREKEKEKEKRRRGTSREREKQFLPLARGRNERVQRDCGEETSKRGRSDFFFSIFFN